MRLELVPTAAHRSDRLCAALEDGDAALAPGTVTMDELRAHLLARLLPALRPATEAIERVVTVLALERERGSVDGAAMLHGGTAGALVVTLDRLRRHGLEAAALARAQDELTPDEVQPQRRLALIASLLEACDRLLGRMGLVARGRVDAALAAALEGEALHRVLGLEAGLTVRLATLFSPDPARVALVQALGRAAQRSGGSLLVQLVCDPTRRRLAGSVERALGQFEAESEAKLELELSLGPSLQGEGEGPASFVRALVQGSRAASANVELFECHGPEEQARQAAHRVEQWLREGFAPERVAVVMRQSQRVLVSSLQRALGEARVAVQDASARTLASERAARALFSLPALCAQGAPREPVLHALAALLGQNAGSGRAAPFRMLEVLRILRVERWLDPGFEARLEAGEHAGKVTATLGAELRRWRGLFAALALEGSALAHAERLRAVLDATEASSRLWDEARAALVGAGHEESARTVLHAVCGEEAALGAAAELLRSVGGWVEASGAGVLSAASFGALLAEAAAAWPLERSEGVGGVWLGEASEAVGRSFDAVVVVGVQQGGFPAYGEHEELLGEAERRALARASGRLLERVRAPEEEALIFLAVLATTQRRLALLSCQRDLAGRLLPLSPLMVDARRALGRAAVTVPLDPRALRVTPAARGIERQLRAWVTLEQRVPAALASRLRSVLARGAMEHERREFFRGSRSEAGRYSGAIAHDEGAMAALGVARWATEERPLDVTALERAARCGFKTFARELLKLEAPVEEQAVLDPKDRGHLVHALVEQGQKVLHGRVGQPVAVTWHALRSALDGATDVFVREHAGADPDLVRAEAAALRLRVEAWLLGRLDAEERWEPVATEVAFGPRREWPALTIEVSGQAPIVLRGRIDGIERMDGSLRVVEFKSGRGDGYGRRLRQGLLDTQFQLVVYAAALAQARGAGHLPLQPSANIDGVYVGFRDLGEYGLREAMAAPRPADAQGPALEHDASALLTQGARGQGPLGDAVRKAIVPLRLGVFAPTPRDCHFCDAASLCRVDFSDLGSEE